jgi:hypothetical protein
MGWTNTATDVQYVAGLLQVTCDTTVASMDPGAPYVNLNSNTCYFSSPGQSTCTAVLDRAHFCCCAPDPSMCDTGPAPAGWNLAAPGESCGAHCGSTGCSTTGRSKANSLITIAFAASEVGETCMVETEATLSQQPIAPYIDTTTGACFFSEEGASSSCTATDDNASQLCCCSTAGNCPVE